MKERNQGFSLIELVVVVAIMLTLTLGMGLGLSALNNSQAKSGAEKLKSQLLYTQTMAMAKTKAYGQIVLRDDTYYYVLTYGDGAKAKTEETKLCDGDNPIYYFKSTDAAESQGTLIDENTRLYISFEKASGAVSPVITNVTSGEYTYSTITNADDSTSYVYCTGFAIRHNDFERVIRMYTNSGKIALEGE